MIHLYEDDKRKNDPDFELNHGSFSSIHLNLNRELKKIGFYAEENAAKWHGFSTGLGLDFGDKNWNRFVIHVWETSVLPQHFINFRHWAESKFSKPYVFFGLSRQISDVWEKYSFKTDTIDIGVNEDFYYPNPIHRVANFKHGDLFKTDKFIVSSVTALNFRSGFDALVEAIPHLDPANYRFIVKNTDDRDSGVLEKIKYLKDELKYDIHYINERLNSYEIREFYLQSNLLCYIPLQTSAGLPILEASACGCPVITNDFCPTNIYPSVLKNKVKESTVAEEKQRLSSVLPYTFPENFIDESRALIYKVDICNFVSNIEKVRVNFDYYQRQCLTDSIYIRDKWSWRHSAHNLVKKLEEKL